MNYSRFALLAILALALVLPQTTNAQTGNAQTGGAKSDTSLTKTTSGNKNEFVDIIEELPTYDVNELERNVRYPAEALRDGIEGTVVVVAYLDDKGNVVSTKVISSSNTILNEAAVVGVKETTYTAAKQNGRPIACSISIPVKFIIKRNTK